MALTNQLYAQNVYKFTLGHQGTAYRMRRGMFDVLRIR